MTIFYLVLALVCLIAFSAVLSASETSLFSLSSFTINAYKESQDKRKKLIFKLLHTPRDLLVTIMMLNIFANILVQNTVSSLFGELSSWLLKVGIPLVLTLFFGEVIPKSIALPNNKFISYHLAPFVSIVSKIVKPIRFVITKVTTYISRALFFFLKKEKPLTIEELEHVIEKSSEENLLTSDEMDLVKGYLSLHDSNVKELMTPRDEMLYYDINTSIDELILIFSEKKYTRLPVCDAQLDEILGMLSMKSFFLHKDDFKTSQDLKKYLKKPFFVAETMNAFSLLLELRDRRENIAIVVNEYGSVIGLITQEDLTKEVLGKISDKKDKEQKYTISKQNEIIASAKMEIDDLEDLFNIKLERESTSVTVGGFLTDELGDIPKAGDKLEKNNLLFYVLSADPNRVRRVYIRQLKPSKKRRSKNE
ncbi:MAG: Hemolysin C [Candidatus Anoxychlamydiales bacterium]|uniref:CNNM transmembrane domain-containing protein n=1 Tax=marine sediment metagenome TaxID=412755 RepID=A0A0F9LJ64_9ZZZZ|nr:Hemolysin C [Candidatus Anoxychlamydiales bacterium]NGX40844.1 Hemolysin C [Candidatus Anoxychlamydiales bacterium]HEU65038.1 HlyC/CorC family transporter [Chlamydiota bacterium]